MANGLTEIITNTIKLELLPQIARTWLGLFTILVYNSVTSYVLKIIIERVCRVRTNTSVRANAIHSNSTILHSNCLDVGFIAKNLVVEQFLFNNNQILVRLVSSSD